MQDWSLNRSLGEHKRRTKNSKDRAYKSRDGRAKLSPDHGHPKLGQPHICSRLLSGAMTKEIVLFLAGAACASHTAEEQHANTQGDDPGK